MAYVLPKSTAPSRMVSEAVSDETPTTVGELRSEPRVAADGHARLVLDQDGRVAVDARLVDVSRSGFRALHESTALMPGKVVRFQYFTADEPRTIRSLSGWARVIWTRTEGTQMESGFFVVLSE